MTNELFAKPLPLYHCRTCDAITSHEHWHDTAHGISETHMAGTERFVCKTCGHVTHYTDENAGDYPFVLDNRRHIL